MLFPAEESLDHDVQVAFIFPTSQAATKKWAIKVIKFILEI